MGLQPRPKSIPPLRFHMPISPKRVELPKKMGDPTRVTSTHGFGCHLPRIDARGFLESMRGKRIGFIWDSLNENFLVSFLCVLRSVDRRARKLKRKGAWRRGYFPEFDVMVAYHRVVLLAKYTWQPVEPLNLPDRDGLKGIYKVDVDMSADDWVNVTKYYDVLVFNTGHWNNGVNKEAREINQPVQKALQGSDIRLLNLTHLSEFRADAHPAFWLGNKDAVAVWGQDFMHWCLPGVPDTWVDILFAQIMHNMESV